jgi:hypothetical protein
MDSLQLEAPGECPVIYQSPAWVAAYREAFGKALQYAEFIRAAEAAHLIIKIASGDEVAARVNRMVGRRFGVGQPSQFLDIGFHFETWFVKSVSHRWGALQAVRPVNNREIYRAGEFRV